MAFDLATTVQPYTMATRERIELVMELCQRANAENIPGDFVECGCCNGGLSAVLARFAGEPKRGVHLFDSFEGLPMNGPNDTASVNGVLPGLEVGKCRGSVKDVCEVLTLAAADTVVTFHQGWFAETFPHADIPQVAVLLLDSDWFSSELLCWQKFYPSVVDGGFVYVDDFAYWPGCRKAFDDFFSARGEKPLYHPVGHSAWMQKGEEF